MFFTLIFAVLLLKYKYYANDEFSFTITTNQTRFFCRRRWKSNDLKVIALCMFPRWWSPPSWILSKCYIWLICQKIRYRRYHPVKYGDNRLNGSKVITFFSIFKMASTAILDFIKMLYLISFQKVRHRWYFPVKYGDNRLNCSKVIALC